MSKLSFLLALAALAGCASINAGRDLRVDGSSESSFEQSVARFQGELSEPRQHLFELALRDIWVRGFTVAMASGRAANEDEYAEEYFRQLDGLSYREILALSPAASAARSAPRQRRAAQGAMAPAFAPVPSQGFTGQETEFSHGSAFVGQCPCMTEPHMGR